MSKRKKPSKHQLNSFTQSAVGTKWWNNGIINKRAAAKPGDNFVLGRLLHKLKEQ